MRCAKCLSTVSRRITNCSKGSGTYTAFCAIAAQFYGATLRYGTTPFSKALDGIKVTRVYMKTIIYYWQFAPKVWITILLGWMAVILSAAFKFEFPSSGAILSCSVIVAEIMFTQWSLYYYWEQSTIEGEGLRLPRFFRRRIIELSKEDETPESSAKRIHNNIQRVLAINLVVGTFIWGYGHKFI